MDIAEALEIVLDLAKQSAIDEQDSDIDNLQDERKRQQEAINMIEDLAVNQYGDE